MSNPSKPRERRFLPPARIKPEKADSNYPWLLPAVVAFCVVVVVVAVVWAAMIGHLFT